MKKIIFLLSAALIFNLTFASEIIPKEKKVYANEVLIPIGKSGKYISLAELSTIRLNDLQVITGKKISFFNKIMLKAAQKKLRHSINPDGSFNKKKLNKFFAKAESGETGFHTGGFVLGFLLNLVGVLIAYLIKDDYKSNRVKWAWIGLGLNIGLTLILALAVAP